MGGKRKGRVRKSVVPQWASKSDPRASNELKVQEACLKSSLRTSSGRLVSDGSSNGVGVVVVDNDGLVMVMMVLIVEGVVSSMMSMTMMVMVMGMSSIIRSSGSAAASQASEAAVSVQFTRSPGTVMSQHMSHDMLNLLKKSGFGRVSYET